MVVSYHVGTARPPLLSHLYCPMLYFVLFYFVLLNPSHSEMLWIFLSYLDISSLWFLCELLHILLQPSELKSQPHWSLCVSWFVCPFISFVFITWVARNGHPYPFSPAQVWGSLLSADSVVPGSGEDSPCNNELEVCLHTCSPNKPTATFWVCYKLS